MACYVFLSVQEALDSGCVTVYVERENFEQGIAGGKFEAAPITGFIVKDNGVGFNTENYKSFLTAYSTYKVAKGCKGIGRFLWLLAFESVTVTSVFCENDKYYERAFEFTSSGISPENNVKEIEKRELETIVRLNDYKHRYREKTPVALDAIAKKIIEHCLPFFILNTCPRIILQDNASDSVVLNSYFDSIIKPSLHRDDFSLGGKSFILYHLKMPEGVAHHELHLCANQREVETIDLSKSIANLQKRIQPTNGEPEFYYLGYITSVYLDDNVSVTRVAFNIDDEGDQISLQDTTKKDIIESANSFIRLYLKDYLDVIEQDKVKQIDSFVAHKKPNYRYMMKNNPKIYDEIPAGLSEDKLEMTLHKAEQAWEREIYEQGRKVE